MSVPSAERPCLVCGALTTNRYGTVGWMKDMPFCPERHSCIARRAARQRAQEQRRQHPPVPTERDLERGRELAEEEGW